MVPHCISFVPKLPCPQKNPDWIMSMSLGCFGSSCEYLVVKTRLLFTFEWLVFKLGFNSTSNCSNKVDCKNGGIWDVS